MKCNECYKRIVTENSLTQPPSQSEGLVATIILAQILFESRNKLQPAASDDRAQMDVTKASTLAISVEK